MDYVLAELDCKPARIVSLGTVAFVDRRARIEPEPPRRLARPQGEVGFGSV